MHIKLQRNSKGMQEQLKYFTIFKIPLEINTKYKLYSSPYANPNKIIMKSAKIFQRTSRHREDAHSNPNPQYSSLNHESNHQIANDSQTCRNDSDNIFDIQRPEQVSSFLHSIYQKLFGSEGLDECMYEQRLNGDQMADKICSQIDRLVGVEQEFAQMMQISGGNSALSSDEKWKLVVLSYRDKIRTLQRRMQQQKQARVMLQQTVQLQAEEKERLSQMNSMKHRKINTLLEDIEQKQAELSELNDTIHQLQLDVSEFKESNSVLHEQVRELNGLTAQLSMQLEGEREKSLLNQQNNRDSVQAKMLGDEQQQINKQISDLKTKYQIQIAKLQNKISNQAISNQQSLLLVQQLQWKVNQLQHKYKSYGVDQQTQTDSQVVRACYFNSLADDLEDQSEDGVDLQSYQNLSHNINRDENVSDDDQDEFHLPLGSHSICVNQTLTDRSMDGGWAKDTMSERGASRGQEASFDEGASGVSFSNSPSKYMETMGQLTSELSEAYQKINELTEKVGELESQKNRIENRLQEGGKEKQKDKQVLGYFTSFFKK